jgi:hypothetical protein
MLVFLARLSAFQPAFGYLCLFYYLAEIPGCCMIKYDFSVPIDQALCVGLWPDSSGGSWPLFFFLE